MEQEDEVVDFASGTIGYKLIYTPGRSDAAYVHDYVCVASVSGDSLRTYYDTPLVVIEALPRRANARRTQEIDDRSQL